MTTDTAYSWMLAAGRAEKRLAEENDALKRQVTELRDAIDAYRRGAEQARPLVEDDPLALTLVQAAVECWTQKTIAGLSRDEQCYALEIICTDWQSLAQLYDELLDLVHAIKHAGIKRLLLVAHDPSELKALSHLTTEWGDLAMKLAETPRSEDEADEEIERWMKDARD